MSIVSISRLADTTKGERGAATRCTFTITDESSADSRIGVQVRAADPASADWFRLEGESERDLAAGATVTVTVAANVPANAAAGEYPLSIRVYKTANPELSIESQSISVQVAELPGAPPPAAAADPARKSAMWILWVGLGVGVVVIIGVLIAVLLSGGEPEVIQVTVPNVIDKNKDQARTDLEDAGLNVASIDAGNPAPSANKVDAVYEQTPEAGQLVDRGALATIRYHVKQEDVVVSTPQPARQKVAHRDSGINVHSPVGGEWNLRGVGDVNGDGTEDVVWQHKNGQVHFWPMSGGKRTGGINVHTPVGGDWNLRAVGDVNGDRTDDIVWQHRNGQVHYWPMKGGKRTGGINIHTPVGSEWHLRDVGDVNGDGTDDIVWQHQNGQVHYWPIKGGKRTGGINIHTRVGSEWRLQGVGDVNGDKTDDIIWQHSNGQVHYWPITDGKRTGGINIHTRVGSEWRLQGVGDVNRDRIADIVWQHKNGQVHYWKMVAKSG